MLTGPADLGPDLVLGLDEGGLLASFNQAGVLAASDVHVARALARLGGETDATVVLAAALAVRSPRAGHVLTDLSTLRETVTAERDEGQGEADLAYLPWPALSAWLEHLTSSPLVAAGTTGGDDRPLRLVGHALYLDRYWRDERAVARDLAGRARAGVAAVGTTAAVGLARLFPEEGAGGQRQAAANALTHLFTVIAGGPGTGKTTTVARLLALIEEQALSGSGEPPLIALAAPTGKAAARMAEAVHDEAGRPGLVVSEVVRQRLRALEASTVHRLLGRHPAGSNRFRHHRDNQLPHDVVVIDEASMMSLPLMARLLEAVRPDARLVLVGDHEQLASVEAGAVFGDIVGPAGRGGPGPGAGPVPRMASSITVLRANHRFTGPLAELAAAIHAGDGDGVMAVLSARQGRPEDDGGVQWLPVDAASAGEKGLAPVRSTVVAAGRALAEAAGRGDGAAALGVLSQARLLCAHRAGPVGASTWNSRAEQWLAADAGERPRPVPPEAAGAGLSGADWYLGRPVVVTENDYSLDLFNGDTGVAIARDDGGLAVVFRRAGEIVRVSPARLGAVQTAFAMTAHRAQGSEFDQVVVLLPSATSRVLTRELLFTAVTRARRLLILVGPEEPVRAAVARPVSRASGLTAELWA
jgi:exodeoxyribonuclease V alpha subunit